MMIRGAEGLFPFFCPCVVYVCVHANVYVWPEVDVGVFLNLNLSF